jgi:dethiobiotin synthetase
MELAASFGKQTVMPAWFVTATGTDIGKTYVTSGLVRCLRRQGEKVRALKPLVSGFEPAAVAQSDPGELLAAMGEPVTEEGVARISPWRFAAPLSPDMAAACEARMIDFETLITFCRAATAPMLFIEGVGGVMVPLDASRTVLDWMAALQLPLVLVTGSYLGTLSHTLTAVDVCRRRGLAIAALVINESLQSGAPLDETRATLARFLPDIPLAVLPRPADEAAFAFLWRLLARPCGGTGQAALYP